MRQIDYIEKEGIIVRVSTELPATVRGCCYHDNDGVAFVLLNADLSPQAQRETLRHELDHIRREEMYNPLYREYQ